jgi:hypothetical protein
MDNISNAMGRSKKTIYKFFKNKEMLVKTCAEFKYNEVWNNIIEIKKKSKNPIKDLYLIKRIICQHLSSEKTSPQYQLQKYYPEIHVYFKEKEFTLFNKSFKESLKKGVEMGLFRSEIKINFITRIYFNGLQGIRDIKLFPTEEHKIEELIEDFFEYHLRAICTLKGIEYLKKKFTKEFNL